MIPCAQIAVVEYFYKAVRFHAAHALSGQEPLTILHTRLISCEPDTSRDGGPAGGTSSGNLQAQLQPLRGSSIPGIFFLLSHISANGGNDHLTTFWTNISTLWLSFFQWTSTGKV